MKSFCKFRKRQISIIGQKSNDFKSITFSVTSAYFSITSATFSVTFSVTFSTFSITSAYFSITSLGTGYLDKLFGMVVKEFHRLNVGLVSFKITKFP